MPLYQITPPELPLVWDIVAPMLQRAIDLDAGNMTSSQVEYALRTGKIFLLVWDEPGEGITGAVTVEIIDYPRARVAHVDLMGGKSIVRKHVFDEAKKWMRLQGATTAQCWAKGTLVHMYEKMGMENTHQVMRVTL